jgi:hypothetical protein
MASLWSLVEDLRNADIANHVNPPRLFSPPLAALVPTGGDDDPIALSRGLPDPSVYSFSERHINNAAATQTTDVAFTINIIPPAAGFPGDPAHPELPAPAFRFHAVARGQVTFRPAQGNEAATLILRTDAFGVIGLAKVPWWERWSEAHCVPREVHYENVDVDHLRDYLLAIPLTGSHGLTFP